jgi:hypothetical protein
MDLLEEVEPGQRLSLVREPENPFDSNAIRVETKKGEMLGYIRRPIARRLAERIEKGALLRAKAAVVLGPEAGPNDRLYIEIKVTEDSAEVQ